MYYEIYIDQLFLENLLLYVLLLRTWGKLSGCQLSWKKVWISSMTGAVAVCTVIFFRISWFWKIGKWIWLLFLWLTAGKENGKKGRRWKALTLIGALAFYSGAFQMIISIWEPPVLLAAVLACMAVDILTDRQEKQRILEEYQIPVILEDQGERWELTGLIDTGNHLKEPLTGRPVSILCLQEAEKIPRFQQAEKEGYLYIPFQAVGTEKGWMKGIVIDSMEITYAGEQIRIKRPVLAVSEEALSGDGRFQMIVHPLHIQ